MASIPPPKTIAPAVSSGSVAPNGQGGWTWEPDPSVSYSGHDSTENGVLRKLTVAEAAQLPSLGSARVLIRKSTAIARVNTLGKIAAVSAALNSDPLAFAKWYAPDWPNVYADDPGLLAVLKGVGCTDAEIATITAPDPTVIP